MYNVIINNRNDSKQKNYTASHKINAFPLFFPFLIKGAEKLSKLINTCCYQHWLPKHCSAHFSSNVLSWWMETKNLISCKLLPLRAVTHSLFVSMYCHFFTEMSQILQTISRLNEHTWVENKGGNPAFSPSGLWRTWGFQACSVGVSCSHLLPHRVLVAHFTSVVYNCPHTATVALF